MKKNWNQEYIKGIVNNGINKRYNKKSNKGRVRCG